LQLSACSVVNGFCGWNIVSTSYAINFSTSKAKLIAGMCWELLSKRFLKINMILLFLLFILISLLNIWYVIIFTPSLSNTNIWVMLGLEEMLNHNSLHTKSIINTFLHYHHYLPRLEIVPVPLFPNSPFWSNVTSPENTNRNESEPRLNWLRTEQCIVVNK